MHLIAERRRHHTARGMVPVFVEILALVQRQMLDQRLAPNTLALLTRPADGFVAVLARRVHNIKRHTRHVGDHDRAVGGFALNLWRARIGVCFGSGIARSHQFRGQFGHHIAVLCMHHCDTAQFGQPVKRRIQLIIIHHQRAFVSEEMFERVDATVFDHRFHLIKDLLAPPRHRHVKAVIAVRPRRFIVPHLQRIMQTLTGAGQREINDHRGATSQCRARPALEIIAGISAHERHLKMRMRVNPAGHDIASRRIKFLVPFQVRANLDDDAFVDQHIRLVGQIMRDDGAVFDDACHVLILPFAFLGRSFLFHFAPMLCRPTGCGERP